MNDGWTCLPPSSLFLYKNENDNTIFIFFSTLKERERKRMMIAIVMRKKEKNKEAWELLVYDGADKQLSGQRLNDLIIERLFFNVLLVTFVILFFLLYIWKCLSTYSKLKRSIYLNYWVKVRKKWSTLCTLGTHIKRRLVFLLFNGQTMTIGTTIHHVDKSASLQRKIQFKYFMINEIVD
jgi:hypothetical protein